MSVTKKSIAAAIAAMTITGLAACGGEIVDPQKVERPGAPAPQTTTQTPEPPSAPALPEFDFDALADQAYLDTLAQEGIDLPKSEALDAAETACELDSQGLGLLELTNQLAAETGLSGEDAAYLYGAAILTCEVPS